MFVRGGYMEVILGELSFCQKDTMLRMSTCCRSLRHPSALPAWGQREG